MRKTITAEKHLFVVTRFFSHDYATSNEQMRMETQTNGKREKGWNERTRPNGVSISVMTARFVAVHRETELMLITGKLHSVRR